MTQQGIERAQYNRHVTITESGYPSLNACDWKVIHQAARELEYGTPPDWHQRWARQLNTATEDPDEWQWSATWSMWDGDMPGLIIQSWNDRCEVFVVADGHTRITFASPSVTHVPWVMALGPTETVMKELQAVTFELDSLEIDPAGKPLAHYAARWQDQDDPRVFYTFEPETLRPFGRVLAIAPAPAHIRT
jgi:hypothetical protein